METVRELLIALGLDVHQAEFVEAIGLEHLLEKASEMQVEVLKEIPEQLAEVVHATAEYAHQLEDMSERTGISTESLQQFGYIAGLAGISTEEMEMSVNHLSRAMDAARNGNEEAGKAFARLGVKVTDAHGKLRQADEVLGDLAEGFEKLPKGPERTALAMDIFSRGGAKMLNVLHGGKKGVEALKEEFAALGLGMDEDAIKKGAELETNFKRMGAVIESLKHELAGPLIEALGPIIEDVLEWVKANRALISSRILQFARALVVVLKLAMNVLEGVGKTLLWVIDNWKHLAVIVGGVVVAALAANASAIISTIGWYIALGVQAAIAGAVAAAAWLAAAAPVIIVAAAFAALLLLLDDFLTYMRGGDSMIGRFGKDWLAFVASLTGPLSFAQWDLFFTKLKGLLDYFQTNWPKAIDAFAQALRGIWDALPSPLRRALEVGASTVSMIGGGANPAVAAGLAVAGAVTGTGDVNASFVINAPAGASAEAIAHSTVSQLEDFHARKMREAIAAGGG